MTKAKVGDYITITDGAKTALPSFEGRSGIVVRVGAGVVFINAQDLVRHKTHYMEVYVRDDCYEIHPLTRSPLWEALR